MDIVFEHANITVASTEKSLSFLRIAFPDWKIRGEGKLSGSPNEGRWMHFGTQAFYITLQQNDDHQEKREETYIHDGINHLGFVIKDMDSLIQRMADKGYEPSPMSSLDGHPFRKRAYFYDGNGLEWEFVQYLSDKIEERNDYTL